MLACTLGVGFGPFRFSEAHQALNLQSLLYRNACAEKKPGRACKEPAALELRRAVVIVLRERVVVCHFMMRAPSGMMVLCLVMMSLSLTNLLDCVQVMWMLNVLALSLPTTLVRTNQMNTTSPNKVKPNLKLNVSKHLLEPMDCDEGQAWLYYGEETLKRQGLDPAAVCTGVFVSSPGSSASWWDCLGTSSATCYANSFMGSNDYYVISVSTPTQYDMTQEDFSVWMKTAITVAGDSTDTSTYRDSVQQLLTTYLKSEDFFIYVADNATAAELQVKIGSVGTNCLQYAGQSSGGLSVHGFVPKKTTSAGASE